MNYVEEVILYLIGGYYIFIDNYRIIYDKNDNIISINDNFSYKFYTFEKYNLKKGFIILQDIANGGIY